MPSQQMKGCGSIQIETVSVKLPTDHVSSSIDTSSIAITHYNNQHTSILHKQSPIAVSTLLKLVGRFDTQLSTTNNKASLLLESVGRIDSFWILLQRSSVEPLLPKSIGRTGFQLSLLNRICSYFGSFSQSTACNATRFGDCSYTLLDRL